MESMDPADTTILVVDDERLNRTLMTVALTNVGYTVLCAEHGREALEKLRERPYDALLLDLLMPEVDGFQVLEQIQHDEDMCHTPVLVTSGLDDMESIMRCLEMGAIDFVPKPFELPLLQARVASALVRRRLSLLEAAYRHERQHVEALLARVIPRGAALVASDLTRPTLCNRIVQEAVSLGAAVAGRLYLCTQENRLSCEAGAVPSGGLPLITVDASNGSLATRRTPAAEAIQRAAPLCLETAEQVAAFDMESWKVSGIGRVAALLAVPLKTAAGRPLGVLELVYDHVPAAQPAGHCSLEHAQSISAFGQLAAAALEQHTEPAALFAGCR